MLPPKTSRIFGIVYKSDKIKIKETVEDYMIDVYNLTRQLEYVSTIGLVERLAGKLTEAIQLKKVSDGASICQLEV